MQIPTRIMAINRSNWIRHIPKSSILSWHCPTCNFGVLKVKKDSITHAETRRSRLREDREYDEGGYQALFIGYLECSNCGEVLAISGRVETYGESDYRGTTFERVLWIKYVNPAPHIFPLPDKCPREVALQLIKSFQLFWIDLDATANKVRQAVEALMDFLNIDKVVQTKKGKSRRVDLHERIVLFQAKEKDLGDLLLAIKWIGNSGSHESAIKSDDIFDAYDIVEQVIEDMFTKSKEKIASLAKEINTIKGPRSTQLRPSTKNPSEKE